MEVRGLIFLHSSDYLAIAMFLSFFLSIFLQLVILFTGLAGSLRLGRARGNVAHPILIPAQWRICLVWMKIQCSKRLYHIGRCSLRVRDHLCPFKPDPALVVKPGG